MRPLSEVLAIARQHIAGGWSPLISRDASGAMCDHLDEGITRFCIVDALLAAAQGDLDLWWAAGVVLRRQAGKPLGDWEAAPKRKQADVLQLFTRAHFNAVAGENR